MLIVAVVILSVLLCLSGLLNIVLFKKAELQLNRAEVYEAWILELRREVTETYKTIKSIDDRQMFEKDDDVGVVFQQMVKLLKELHDKTQETEE